MSAEVRAEIIANQSVQEDIIEALDGLIEKFEYTILPVVHGKGLSSSKLGDTVWPEHNFILFSYTTKEIAKKIKEAVANVYKKFPNEGIVLYFTPVVEI